MRMELKQIQKILNGEIWRDNDLKDDILKQYFAKHAGKEFGIKSLNEYIYKSRKIIKNTDSVFIQNYKGGMQYFFASSSEKGYAIVDRFGIIRGCYGHGDKKGAYKYQQPQGLY